MEKRIIARGLLSGAIASVPAFVFARNSSSRSSTKPSPTRTARPPKRQWMARWHHEHGANCSPEVCRPTSAWGSACWRSASRWAHCSPSLLRCLRPRRESVRPRLLSVFVAGGMFSRLCDLPFLKYPPIRRRSATTRPSRQRTLLYLLMVVLSVLLLVAAVCWAQSDGAVRRVERNADRRQPPTSSPSAVVMVLLPTIDETPGPIVNAQERWSTRFPGGDLYISGCARRGRRYHVGDHRGGVRPMVSRLLERTAAAGGALVYELSKASSEA